MGFRLALFFALLSPLPASEPFFTLHPSPQYHFVEIAPHPNGTLYLLDSAGRLSLFDGYRFHLWAPASLPTTGVPQHIAVDGLGHLWVAYPTALYAFQDTTLRATFPRHSIRALLPTPTSVIGSDAYPFEYFASGQSRLLYGAQRVSPPVRDPSGVFFFLNETRRTLLRFIPGQPPTPIAQLPSAVDHVAPAGPGQLWLYTPRQAFLWDGQQLQVPILRSSPQTPLILPGRSHSWLSRFPTLSSPQGTFDLPTAHRAFPITAAAEDTSGRLWLAHRGLGLVAWSFHSPALRWPADSSFRSESVTLVTTTPSQTWLAATHSHLYQLSGSHWRQLTTNPLHFHGLAALSPHQLLATTRERGIVSLNPQGELLRSLPLPPDPHLSDNSRLIFPSPHGVFITNKHGLLALRDTNLELVPLPQQDPDQPYPNDITLDAQGQLWVAHNRGIAYRTTAGLWQALPTSLPLTHLRTLALSPDGQQLFVGTRNGGKIFRLTPQASTWQVQPFSLPPGFASAHCHFLRFDSRGWLWIGTDKGVFLSDGRHTGALDFLHLSADNLLTANDTDQYGFFAPPGGQIVIAGSGGVSLLNPSPNWFQAPPTPPVLTHTSPSALYFAAPPSPTFRTHPLLYRFSPTNPWQPVIRGEVPLPPDISPASIEVAWNHFGPWLPRSFPLPTPPRALLSTPHLALLLPLTLGLGWWQRDRFLHLSFLLRSWLQRHQPPSDEPARTNYTGHILQGLYQIHHRLNSGGSSDVYTASGPDAQPLVIKLLPLALFTHSPQNPFAMELAALQSVTHPGIVPLRDWGIAPNGDRFLVMPHLPGPTLAQRLATAPPLSLNEIATLLDQLAAALTAAHQRGIIHRDLKPTNVLLTPGQAVLIDFGAAAFLGPAGQLAQTRALQGTLLYLAPERLLGRYSPATDLYGLALIACEALTGQPLHTLALSHPSPSPASSLAAALQSCLSSTHTSTIAHSLAAALHPDPAQRPPDLLAWAHSLTASLRAAA